MSIATPSKSIEKKKESSAFPFRAIYIVLIGLIFLINYSKVYDNKVSLMGDNVTYLSMAKSLADGEGYRIQFLADEPLQLSYPPLYSATLSLFLEADVPIQESLSVAKKINGFFLLGSLIVAFLLFSKLTNNQHLAFLVCAVLLFNTHLLAYSFIVMSEMYFLFWAMLSLLFLVYEDFKEPWYKSHYFLLSIITLTLGYYTRTIGLTLFAGMIIYFIFSRKWSYLMATIVSFVVLAMPWHYYVASNGESFYVNQIFSKNPYQPELGMMNSLGDWLTRVIDNLERYLNVEFFDAVFGVKSDFSQGESSDLNLSFLGLLQGVLLCVVSIYGCLKLPKFKFLILGFIIGTMAVVLCWPSVWYGPRFIIPLIPIITLCFFHGIFKLMETLNQSLKSQWKTESFSFSFFSALPFFIFSIVFMIPGYNQLIETANSDFSSKYKLYFSLAEWSSKNTSESAVIACRKPGLFYFFSNRKTIRFIDEEDEIIAYEYLKNNNINYVILDGLGYSATSKYLLPVVQKYSYNFTEIKTIGIPGDINLPMNSILQIDTTLGYFGEFKNGLKSGQGKFLFKDGSYYVGEWKEDVKSGYGEFYWADGKAFKGRWSNDFRNGDGILFVGASYEYKGMWVNDQMQGIFEIKDFVKGIHYKALFKDNEMMPINSEIK